MHYFKRLTAAVAMFSLAGCFQVETLVRVNPDGSGTVVETMMLSREMIAGMNGMMQGLAGENGAKPPPMELFEPDKLKAQAAAMGEGVVYLSGEKCETDKYSGYRVTYAFKDINKLSLGGKGGESAGEAGASKPSMPVKFSFTKGPPATLTIVQPRDEKKEGHAKEKAAETGIENVAPQQEGNGAISESEAKQIADMFMGMKMGLAVEVNGAIVETNATHREGSRITIIDFDLTKFGSSLPQMEKLKKLESSSPAEAMELIKAIPGMKVDLNDRVKVVFGR